MSDGRQGGLVCLHCCVGWGVGLLGEGYSRWYIEGNGLDQMRIR